MSETSPFTAVNELAWKATPLPQCPEHEYGSGHLCLPVPENADQRHDAGLMKKITAWYGEPLTLDVRRSHPLLDPFPPATEPVLRMHAWPCNRRWIGYGTTRRGTEEREVLLLADRATPAVQRLPEELSWAERVVAVTGWTEGGHQPPPLTVDWTAVQERLGTALPDDYRQLAEIFGYGAFDGYLRFHVPDAQSNSLVQGAEFLAEFGQTHPDFLAPYPVHPAPGGLLQWADTQQGHTTYWLTEGGDPNRWPILTIDDAHDEWRRFDGTTGEFIFRMLTDPLLPFLRAESQDVPWFTRYGSV